MIALLVLLIYGEMRDVDMAGARLYKELTEAKALKKPAERVDIHAEEDVFENKEIPVRPNENKEIPVPLSRPWHRTWRRVRPNVYKDPSARRYSAQIMARQRNCKAPSITRTKRDFRCQDMGLASRPR